jgi:hypothetical protein
LSEKEDINQIVSTMDEDLIARAKEELGLDADDIVKLLMEATVKTGNKKYRDPTLYFKEKYEFYPPSPERWLLDDYYFGHVGKAMFDPVKEDFLSIMTANPRPLRVGLMGSIGWGKTFLSCACIAFLVTELACLRNPQSHYGLSPGTHISLMNLAVSATHAKRVFFAALRDMIDLSPFFKEQFKRRIDITSFLYWPQRLLSIVPGSSSELAPLGENLFGGVIEEANFFQVSTTSKKISNPAEREWDQAKKLHDSIWRRMKSRYQRSGRCPGMLILNSSAKYPDDFMDKVEKENDPATMIVKHAEWETKPTHRYSGRRFFVFVGDQSHAPKVLKDEQVEEYRRVGAVVSVPEEYRTDFDRNLEGAVRDIVGKNVRSIQRFLSDDEKLRVMIDESIPIPFPEEFAEGLTTDDIHRAIIPQIFSYTDRHGTIVPRLHPGKPRFAHVDLGVSGDACGLAVVHIGDEVEGNRRVDGQDSIQVVVESLPVIYVDLLLRILPGVRGEVDIATVRQIFYDLRDKCGVHFNKITYDQFQSKESLQTLQRVFSENIVGYQSVDRTPDAYLVLKECIGENRIKCYGYLPLFRELRTLFQDPKTGKVDHPPNSSKDVADGLAGATFNAIQELERSFTDVPQRGIIESPTDMNKILAQRTRAWLTDQPTKVFDDAQKELEDELAEEAALERELAETGLKDEEDPFSWLRK